MKVLNLIVCVCFTLSLVGCAANRPHVMHKPADASASADSPTPETPVCEKPEGERPIWEKCKKAATTTAIVVTAPVWVPAFVFVLWYGLRNN